MIYFNRKPSFLLSLDSFGRSIHKSREIEYNDVQYKSSFFKMYVASQKVKKRKNVFIDCGAHDGCSVRMFRNIVGNSTKYEIHSFEPNPMTSNIFDEKDVIFHNKAVSNFDGMTDYFMHSNDTLASTTYEKKGLLKNCGSKHEGYVNKIKVPCVRLSSWIKNNYSKDDIIILKLDIEGEEYKVIPDIINNKCSEFINILLIEWHSKWMGLNENIDNEYELKLKNSGVDVIAKEWDASSFIL